jgi:hypothetical protein
MPTPRSRPAVVGLAGKLVVAGGFDLYERSVQTVEAYDPIAETWTELAPLPTARGDAAAAILNGKMYVLGGSVTASHGIRRPASWTASRSTTRLPTAGRQPRRCPWRKCSWLRQRSAAGL